MGDDSHDTMPSWAAGSSPPNSGQTRGSADDSRSAFKIGIAIFILAGIAFVYFISSDGDGMANRNTTSAQADPRMGMSPPNATQIDFRALDADPARFKGQNITFQGTVLNVSQEDGYTWIQVLANEPDIPATASIVVELVPPDSGVLKGNCIRVYGVGAGTTKIKLLTTGVVNDNALVAGYLAEKESAGLAGFCSAP